MLETSNLACVVQQREGFKIPAITISSVRAFDRACRDFNQYIFGVTPYIFGYQVHLFLLLLLTKLSWVTDFVLIFRVCPRAQGAQET